jgi:hypothetical protein
LYGTYLDSLRQSYKLKFASNPKRRKKKHALDLLPYPPELTLFQPVDRPNNQYSQLYKPIGNSPYNEAGIKGLEPPKPFAVAGHFARLGDFCDFHFPTLSKLNNKFKPFPWLDGNKRRRIVSNDVVKEEPILDNGPPPSPVLIQAPPIPPISLLVRSIINSSDWLFFVSHSLGNPSIQEWRLVRVALSDSTSLSPSCLQDGRFLVEFYTLHFDDVSFNATNQRYRLQYHSIGEIAMPTSSMMTHLIHPSNSSEALAA